MVVGGSVAAFGLGTAALWGAADFTGGLVAKRAAPAFVVAVAHGLALIVLVAVALLFHIPLSSFGLYPLLSGVLCGAGLIALYRALSLGSMGLSAAVSGVLTAVIPVLFSWFREGHAAPHDAIGFGVAAVAIWLVSYTPSQPHPRGLALAVLAGLSFGVMLVLMHIAAAHGVLSALIAMRIASTSVAALSVLLIWFTQNRKESASVLFPAGKLLLLAMLAGVLDTSGNLLYLFASLVGRLDVAAVLSSLYPAGTMLLAAWLLKERATRAQTAGMALALAAVVLISI
jgi:drug/metabolite transporter (DMT)-like permease